MSTEINTRNDVLNIFSTFPDGNRNESLTKSELLSGSGNLTIVQGGDTECVPVDYISFKTYVCKDSWDKAPQGNEHYKIRVENENIFYIYFTNEVGTISFSNLMVGDIPLPFNPKSISKGQTTENFIYITHEGNRLKCQWIKGVIQEAAIEDFAKFQMTYEGTTYDVHIDSLNLGITYNYILEVSPTTINFPASGGSQLLTINSKRETYRNGVLETIEDQGFRYDLVGDGFSMNQRSVVASANTGSQRTGYVNVIQYGYDGNKTVRVDFTQAAATPTYKWEIIASPGYLSWSNVESGGEKSSNVTCEYLTLINGEVVAREAKDWYVSNVSDNTKWNVRKSGNTLYCGPRGMSMASSSATVRLTISEYTTTYTTVNLYQEGSN